MKKKVIIISAIAGMLVWWMCVRVIAGSRDAATVPEETLFEKTVMKVERKARSTIEFKCLLKQTDGCKYE
ncbi:MAG: hypothetical protein K2H40_10450, partial [Lachnospiraceae bacterium]|nr:hypothetical protein [Lachnospiraceae bacterium]